MFCKQVQLVLVQLGHQILGQNQGIGRGKVVGNALLFAGFPDKGGVEVRIVGHQHTTAHELHEFRQNFGNIGGTLDHIVGDAGEIGNFLGQALVGIHKGLEPIHLFAILQNHGTDLNDPVRPGRKAGSFQVKGNKFPIKGHILAAVDHDPVIHIVDIVALTAIEDPDDLICVEGTNVGAEAYEVGFQLTTDAAKDKIWYKYSSAGGYEVFGNTSVEGDNADKANEYLESVEPALLYARGQTYYIVDIKHLGKKDTPSEYGIVRNHVYQIDIESINGYGSPVYNGLSNLENPEYPEVSESSYVAAKINVLSWKVVQQSVDIKPNPTPGA